MRAHVAVSIIAGLSLIASGCGVVDDEATAVAERGVQHHHGALAYQTGAQLWPSIIEVCFQNSIGTCANRCTVSHRACSSTNDCDAAETCSPQKTCTDNTTSCTLDSQCAISASSYADAKNLTSSAMVGAWSEPSGITFLFHGDCPAQPAAGWMAINLLPTGWGGSCGLGYGSDCTFGTADRGRIQDTAVHEVGHGLGLPHEHQRTDAANCAWLQATVVGCQACTDGSCSATNLAGCTCTAAEFNDCLGGSRSGVQTLTKAEYQTALEKLANMGPIPTAAPLTPYDPLSIMNYCTTANGRVVSSTDPLASDWRPTAYDMLGIEVLYPKTTIIEPVCKEGCLHANGGRLLRTNGLLQDPWTGRGAYPWWTLLPEWRRDGVWVSAGPYLLASQVGSSGLVTYVATNKWNGMNIAGASAAEVSDSKWTAIVMSVL